MKIVFHKHFEKQFKKLSNNQKRAFQERLIIFSENQFHSALHNHPLRGTFKGYRSINIAGDLRAIYKMVKKEIFIFITIDTHDHLYY